ncbi:MAG: hypothetical protein ABIS17_07460 [Casimicrobiaceae bacterium]
MAGAVGSTRAVERVATGWAWGRPRAPARRHQVVDGDCRVNRPTPALWTLLERTSMPGLSGMGELDFPGLDVDVRRRILELQETRHFFGPAPFQTSLPDFTFAIRDVRVTHVLRSDL